VECFSVHEPNLELEKGPLGNYELGGGGGGGYHIGGGAPAPPNYLEREKAPSSFSEETFFREGLVVAILFFFH